MKWIPFAILTLIALVLQTTVLEKIEFHSVRPDLMFILAVYYALWAPWPDAGIAACILGFVFDAQSLQPMGLHTLCYGSAAYGIFRLRQFVLREHAVAQFAITAVFTLLVQLVIWIYLHSAAAGGISWGTVFRVATLTSLYTALLAPFIYSFLHRFARWTGLRVSSRTQVFR
jgi:rod shape-determining protein MreD